MEAGADMTPAVCLDKTVNKFVHRNHETAIGYDEQ